MALTQIDRELIAECLERKPEAWQSFADRFVGLFVHVVRHTAECRNFPLGGADIDDLCGEIFSQIVADDFRILRHFRGKSSLATYLTVIARRVAVHEMITVRKKQGLGSIPANGATHGNGKSAGHAAEFDLENRDLIQYLIGTLPEQEARIVQAYHLDGKTYGEISTQLGIPENSIGPVLTRAREHLRQAAKAAT